MLLLLSPCSFLHSLSEYELDCFQHTHELYHLYFILSPQFPAFIFKWNQCISSVFNYFFFNYSWVPSCLKICLPLFVKNRLTSNKIFILPFCLLYPLDLLSYILAAKNFMANERIPYAVPPEVSLLACFFVCLFWPWCAPYLYSPSLECWASLFYINFREIKYAFSIVYFMECFSIISCSKYLSYLYCFLF
jgi:hypothetical protein